MSVSVTRWLVCWVLLMAVPPSLLGQTPAAILHSQGGVWVNSYEARDGTAIFTGDLLETKPGFSASLSLEGSTVLIQPESVAKLQADLLVLDHGSVSVTTSKGFRVRVNCITVVPVVNDWTQYDVTDLNGTVQVAAHKKDVNVEHGAEQHKASPETAAAQGGSVREGEQHSYNESEVCGAAERLPGGGSILSSKWTIGGAAAGVGILICVLLCGGKNAPISPAKP